MPLIKDYLEVSVKNDDALVKLAAVVQRLVSSSNKEDTLGSFFFLFLKAIISFPFLYKTQTDPLGVITS